MSWQRNASGPKVGSIKDRGSNRKRKPTLWDNRSRIDSHPWENRSYLVSYDEAAQEVFMEDLNRKRRKRLQPYYRDCLEKLAEWKKRKNEEKELISLRQIIRPDVSAMSCQEMETCLRTPEVRKRKYEDTKENRSPTSSSAMTPQGDRRSRTPYKPEGRKKKSAKRRKTEEDAEFNPFSTERKGIRLGTTRNKHGPRVRRRSRSRSPITWSH